MLNSSVTYMKDQAEILEELKTQDPVRVVDLVKQSENAICGGATSDMRGMPAYYIFWWVGNPVPIVNSLASTSLIQGYNSFNDENSFLNPDFSIPRIKQNIPLYGGLTRALSHRLSLHLKLAADGRLESYFTNKRDKSPVYSYHQLRLGLEELFPNQKDSKQMIFENVGMTYLFAEDEEEILNNKDFVYKLHNDLKPLLNVRPIG